MSLNIGDLFLRVLAEDAGFRADLVKKAEKAGDEAGKTLGQRMGAAVKANGAKIIGATFAAGLAIAGRGILELQNITADFRAETGASEEAADRAGKAINRMAGDNIQPMSEVGEALTKVHTDLGLVGDEAEATTERFLKFGRVTKRNAALEVLAFDDILDAWNLTADHSGEIMDALIVSHQRYGGVIADDEQALRDLAPALLAANQTWEDALALINLFKASGADTATAVTGITKALDKVKSPEELKALIDDIIATEDPLLRAQKAADLFGVKAGAKLANVLKPGIGGLEDYAIAAEDAAGATEEAADVLDSTWGARFQLLLKKAGSAIIGFGNEWGGLATVIATTLTVAGGLGGGKLVTLLSGGLKGAFLKVAGSSIVTKAVAFAGDKAATAYLKALIAGDAIGEALRGVWTRVATSGPVQAAISGVGKVWGTSLAKATAAGFIAVALVALAAELLKLNGALRQQQQSLIEQNRAFVTQATREQLEAARAGVQAQLDELNKFNIGEALFGSAARESSRSALEQIITDIDGQLGTLPPKVAGSMEEVNFAVHAAAENMAVSTKKAAGGFGTITDAAKNTRTAIKLHADAIAGRIQALTATLLGEATALINGYYDPIIAQDELRVLKDEIATGRIEVNAARQALAKTKAGTEERRQAQLTLDNAILSQHRSLQALNQTRLNLLASGQLSRKEQKTWLAELEKTYDKATGAAKTDIGELIKKIHELQKVPTTIVDIVARITSKVVKSGGASQPRAHGGPVTAGRAYVVGEDRPELFVPDTNGRILPRVPAATTTALELSGRALLAIDLTPAAADALRKAGYSDAEVGRVLAQGVDGLFHNLQSLQAMTSG